MRCRVQAGPVSAGQAGAAGAEARRREPAPPRLPAAFVVVVTGSHVRRPAADLRPAWPPWTAATPNHATVEHYCVGGNVIIQTGNRKVKRKEGFSPGSAGSAYQWWVTG